MNFALPAALAIAASVIPVSVLLVLWKGRWTNRQLSAVIAPRLRAQLTSSIDWWKRRVKTVLFVFAFVFMLIAIARPQWGVETTETERSSIAFFIGLDISRSMLAEDVRGGARLRVAKDGIGRLLRTLENRDAVGLIAFAGNAFVASPVTLDYKTVESTLASLEPQMIERPGSDLAAAIQIADKSFRDRKFEAKALVLITDGEQLQGDAIIAAEEAARNGMRVFTVGVGSGSGARIPERQKNGSVRFVRNEFGNEVISRLNPRVLQQIATSGHGTYEFLGEEGGGLVRVYEQGVRPLGVMKRDKRTKDPGEYFQWPLALAIALFLIEMLVNERRKHPRSSVG